MAPEFDVEEYARTRYSAGASLGELYDELTQKHHTLRSTLHHLLRQHYGDLLGLSERLTGVSQAVTQAHPALEEILDRVQATQTTLETQQEEIDEKLKYRAQVRERRAHLRVLLDIAQLLDRAENALQAENRATDTAGDVLESAAGDVAQIKYYVARATAAEHVQPLVAAEIDDREVLARATVRMQAVEELLVRALSETLAQCVDSLMDGAEEGAGRVAQCLRAFDAADLRAAGFRALQERLQPLFVLRAVTDRGMGMDATRFAAVLSDALTHCDRLGTPLRSAGVPNEIAHVFWNAITGAIYDALPLVFVPAANPQAFHANYRATGEFVAEFARVFGMDSKDALFAEFQRKWQVAAYFAVRRAEIIDAVESGEAPAVERAIKALERCWADDVALPPVAGRLWQLSLQVVRWAKDALAADYGAPDAEGDDDAGVEQALAYARDIIRLRLCADGLPTRAAAQLPECPTHTLDLLRAAIESAFAPLDDAVATRIDKAAGALVALRCAVLASHVRRTTSQYRHTGRMPQRASAYVAQLFAAPTMSDGGVADGEAGRRLSRAVCSGVSSAMARQVSEALATVSRTEASLRRLRGAGRLEEREDGAALVPRGVDLRGRQLVSDDDKIRRQLWLDVEDAARAISALDAQPHEDFARLRSEIAPFGE